MSFNLVTSDTITEIAAALAKAQGAIGAAHRGGTNPHFRSKYADLADINAVIREPLAANGLAVVPNAESIPLESGSVEVSCSTLLLHESGEWIQGASVRCITDPKPQSVGSAITYMRRYSLSALLNISAEDDDGESAQGRPPVEKPAQKRKAAAAPGANGDDGSQVMRELSALNQSWKGRLDMLRSPLGGMDALEDALGDLQQWWTGLPFDRKKTAALQKFKDETKQALEDIAETYKAEDRAREQKEEAATAARLVEGIGDMPTDDAPEEQGSLLGPEIRVSLGEGYKCSVCKQEIERGQRFADAGPRKRSHEDCLGSTEWRDSVIRVLRDRHAARAYAEVKRLGYTRFEECSNDELQLIVDGMKAAQEA